MTTGRTLDERLAAAGVAAGTDPVTAWRKLYEREGPHATVIDLYELAARPQGLAAHELPFESRVELARLVMPDVWPGWTLNPGSDRRGDVITVVEYDDSWPSRYQRWRRQLESVLAGAAVRIEHVGSTSVPGLAAKPIVDIQVSVADLQDEPRYLPPIETLGLQLRSRDEWHRYFRPVPGTPREVHVHVCEAGSNWEREHLVFRDRLRSDPAACARYAAAKRQAAARWADDGVAYTDTKTEIILQILAETPT